MEQYRHNYSDRNLNGYQLYAIFIVRPVVNFHRATLCQALGLSCAERVNTLLQKKRMSDFGAKLSITSPRILTDHQLFPLNFMDVETAKSRDDREM
ncbi:MAG: hypothetical protein ABL882_06640 [Sphingopyxis sp.]